MTDPYNDDEDILDPEYGPLFRGVEPQLLTAIEQFVEECGGSITRAPPGEIARLLLEVAIYRRSVRLHALNLIDMAGRPLTSASMAVLRREAMGELEAAWWNV